jgi:putative tryptophan/tyrosine transport system substrate-binding protein
MKCSFVNFLRIKITRHPLSCKLFALQGQLPRLRRADRQSSKAKVKMQKTKVKSTFGFRLAATILLTTVETAEAQQPKVPRIGYLVAGSSSSEALRIKAFREGLRQLGYVEGQNIIIEYRYGDGRPARIPDLAADLVRLKVDVIVAGGTPIRTAKDTTSTLPIVMAVSTDPVESGFVESLARPGGNITGLSSMASELSGKRLGLFKEAFPKVNPLAGFWHGTIDTHFKEAETAAQSLGFKIQWLELRGAKLPICPSSSQRSLN